MFVQRIRVASAPGKAAEVEAQLVEWVKSDKAGGRRVGLARRILSSEGPGLVVTRIADDLAGLERIRQEDAASADFRARAGRITPLLREPPRTVLFETILPAPPRTGTTITVLSTAYPAPGKEGQIVSILEELVRSAQAAGVTVSLNRRVFSSDGSAIATIGRYADLSEFDRVRKERAPILREAGAAVSELSRAPIAQRLTEVVVPIPST